MDTSIIDEETFLFIYSNLCKQNNITYTDDDIHNPDITGDNYTIIYLINKIVSQIVIMTNRNQFPKALKYLVVDMVQNAYDIIKQKTDPAASQNITSMSEEGRSVSFGSTSAQQTQTNLFIEQQLAQNQNLINKYKLLYKVGCPYAEN